MRELQFIPERYGQWWAYQLSLLLTTILCQVQVAKAQGQTALAPEQRDAFQARYAAILEQGFEANPIPIPLADVLKKEGVPSALLPATFWSGYALNKPQCLLLWMTLRCPSITIKPNGIYA